MTSPFSTDGRPLRARGDAPPKYSRTDPLLESFLGIGLDPLRQYGGRAKADALGDAWIETLRTEPTKPTEGVQP